MYFFYKSFFLRDDSLWWYQVIVYHWLQVDGRLPAIEQRYDELESLSAARRQALEGALALYRMFSEAGACLLWVEEKEQWLDGMEIPTKLEDLEVVQQRLVWVE